MKDVMKVSLFVLAMILLGWQSVFSQSKNFPKDVNLIKMTDVGVAVIGTDDALYGIDKNGKELWKNEKLRKVEKEKVNILSGSELVFVKDKGILGTNKVLNVLTGQDYTEGYIADARVIHATNQLWISPAADKIQVWDITSNKLLYNLETKTPFPLIKTFSFMQLSYTGEKSAILHLALGQLGEYDLMTGKVKWLFDFSPYKIKKPNGDKGDRASSLARGYSMMKIDETDNTLYFPFRESLLAIDSKTGKGKWDVKANKTGKVKDMYITDDGILVYAGKGLQLIDKKSGQVKWDKPLKIKGDGGFLLNDNATFYIVSKGMIQRVDIASKTTNAITSKIKFQGGESFNDMEIMGDLIVLSAKQTVMGIDKNSGAIKFNTFYKAPGKSGLSMVTNIVANVALQSIAMANNAQSRNNAINSGSRSYRTYTPALIKSREGKGGGSATNDTGKYIYISTKFKEAGAMGFGVAKVDKTTGKTIKKVVIGDRNPIYEVDENGGVVFYKSGKKNVSVKPVN